MSEAMHRVASEARTIERRLAQSRLGCRREFLRRDMVIYPDIRLLLRALERPGAHELAARFLPIEINYPALGRWLERVAAIAPKAARRAGGADAARLDVRRRTVAPPPSDW